LAGHRQAVNQRRGGSVNLGLFQFTVNCVCGAKKGVETNQLWELSGGGGEKWTFGIKPESQGTDARRIVQRHPCKIYNILAVSAPVIYIGPRPSHVTEILEGSNVHHPWIGVQHGEADRLADQIQNLRQKTAISRRLLSTEVTAAFSKGVLLPELIVVLVGLRDDK
jgi:hypothetical protein